MTEPKKSQIILTLVLLLSVSISGLGQTQLDLIPSESLFCVRINNFDQTFNSLDMFLAGASPMPMGTSMLVRMQLAGMLGDPSLQSLDTASSFAIFGMANQQNSNTKEPDMFIAALFPVKDYQQFISANQNVGESDANGISKITTAGMGGPGKTMIVSKAGQFALISSQKKYDEVLSLSKSISQGKVTSIAKSLDTTEAKHASQAPVWLYGDIQQINKAFGPLIAKGFEQIQAQIKNNPQMAGQNQLINIAAIFDVYLDIVKSFLGQGKYVSITLKPENEVLLIKKTLNAKPGTEMAKHLVTDPTLPKENKLITYMEDGALANIAAKVKKSCMEKLINIGLSFLQVMDTNSVMSKDQMNKWTQISKDSLEAMGSLFVMSAKVDSNDKPPFAGRYVFEIKDKEKYDKVLTQSFELMNESFFDDMYKTMGMQAEFKLEKGVDTYKGISIDSAKFAFKLTDSNSQEAQMLANMYGDGFDYRMTYVDDLFLTVIGNEPDTEIKKLIDEIKSTDPKQLSSEVKTAMAFLSEAETADFVGTFNIIRYFGIIKAFMPMPIPLPFDQIKTNSNIAFAGKAVDGKAVIDIAFPKQHLTEITTGIMMMQQQMMQQNQQPAPLNQN